MTATVENAAFQTQQGAFTMKNCSREKKRTSSTFRRPCIALVVLGLLQIFLYWNISWEGLRRGSVTLLKTLATVSITKNVSLPTTRPRRIMLWTPMFGKWPPQLNKLARGDVAMSDCVSVCHITRDRLLLESSDAILLHARDTNVNDLPKTRTPFQLWVLQNYESPEYPGMDRFLNEPILFNWTMTYRPDSDVPVPYGWFADNNHITERDNNTLWSSKKKMAVWMASNCWTPGNREGFVEELGRYVQVDVFGWCGANNCPQIDPNACYEKFEREYFFLFAFENSLCKHYVTEKLFLALMYDIVPVVFGGANYSQIAPPGSYIDAHDFESPRTLAEHLKFVAGNETAYKSHFEWKKLYKVEGMNFDDFQPLCVLCSKLHSQAFEKKSYYENVSEWWESGSECWRWNKQEDIV